MKLLYRVQTGQPPGQRAAGKRNSEGAKVAIPPSKERKTSECSELGLDHDHPFPLSVQSLLKIKTHRIKSIKKTFLEVGCKLHFRKEKDVARR